MSANPPRGWRIANAGLWGYGRRRLDASWVRGCGAIWRAAKAARAAACALLVALALGARLRLHRRNISARLCAARRRARANSARRLAGTGADRARHALDGGHHQRRGVLLHFAAGRAPDLVHADQGHRPARDRGLFRQEPKSPAARRIRHQGRQGVRLHQPHDADERQRPQRDHHDFPQNIDRAKARARSRLPGRNLRACSRSRTSAPAPRAATAPRYW